MVTGDRECGVERIEPDDLRLVIFFAAEPSTGGGSSAIPLAGYEPLVLDQVCPLSEKMETALLNSSIRLVPPYEFSAAVVDGLAELPVPAAFTDSGWLTGHRALVLGADGVEIGGVRVRYEHDLGLIADDDSGEDE